MKTVKVRRWWSAWRQRKAEQSLRPMATPAQEGDYLLLCEFDPVSNAFTGDSLSRKVTTLLREFEGLQPGFVIMSIKPRRLP